MNREEEIKEIAYYIWEQDGCLPGNDLRHWLHAEMIWEARRNSEQPKMQDEKKPEAPPEDQKTELKAASKMPQLIKNKKAGNKKI